MVTLATPGLLHIQQEGEPHPVYADDEGHVVQLGH